MKADWVVMGPSPVDGSCLRCGATFKMFKPVEVDVWLAAARAFSKTHRRCRPKSVPPLAKSSTSTETSSLNTKGGF